MIERCKAVLRSDKGDFKCYLSLGHGDTHRSTRGVAASGEAPNVDYTIYLPFAEWTVKTSPVSDVRSKGGV